MLLLGIHIVGIALIVLVVGLVAYRRGVEAGERRIRRRIELQREDAEEASR
jgi:hypothetical protein